MTAAVFGYACTVHGVSYLLMAPTAQAPIEVTLCRSRRLMGRQGSGHPSKRTLDLLEVLLALRSVCIGSCQLGSHRGAGGLDGLRCRLCLVKSRLQVNAVSEQPWFGMSP